MSQATSPSVPPSATPRSHSADNQYPGHLFMVIAPSGAGKSTLVNALLESDAGISLSVSYTTRAPRPGEVDGHAYHFVTQEDFFGRRASGEFIESAEVHGHYYGTSRLWIEKQIEAGHDVLLEIDWQGARQIRRQFGHAVSIFILPPSLEALEERLKKRGLDAPHVIARRLLAAGSEITHAAEADYVVINDVFAQALAQLQSIVTTTRLRFASQCARHAHLFTELGIHTPNAN